MGDRHNHTNTEKKMRKILTFILILIMKTSAFGIQRRDAIGRNRAGNNLWLHARNRDRTTGDDQAAHLAKILAWAMAEDDVGKQGTLVESIAANPALYRQFSRQLKRPGRANHRLRLFLRHHQIR